MDMYSKLSCHRIHGKWCSTNPTIQQSNNPICAREKQGRIGNVLLRVGEEVLGSDSELSKPAGINSG
jgi:hypothetical protein